MGVVLGKKYKVLEAAIPLFASQGFDATTTLQIAETAGVTEPVIYYHFRNKDGLFTYILDAAFTEYFSRLESLETNTSTQFEKIKRFISLHFQFVEDMPDETYLLASTCPAKLRDEVHVCAENIKRQRRWLARFLTDCLNAGTQSGEFYNVPVEVTVNLLIAMINGLLRQRGLQLETIKGMKDGTVEFCRRSLVKS